MFDKIMTTVLIFLALSATVTMVQSLDDFGVTLSHKGAMK